MNGIDFTSTPATDPIEIYRQRDGLYGVDLLGAALVHFDFFTWLAEHPSDKVAICRELKIVERPTDVMLTLFTAMGFVESKTGVFHVTELAREHLVKGSPWYMGPYYASLKDRPVLKDYITVLQTGRTANWGSFKDEKDWAKAMEDETFAYNFTAAMPADRASIRARSSRSIRISRPRSWRSHRWMRWRAGPLRSEASPNASAWRRATCLRVNCRMALISISSRTCSTTGTNRS